MDIFKSLSESLMPFLQTVSGVVWGPIMLVLLLGTGIYLTIGLRFFSFLQLSHAFRLLWQGRVSQDDEKGEVSTFNALMTALAATIGTGNIAGVAVALYVGGPGALFWMWVTAIVGMATKYAETVLAVHYRNVTPKGSFVGGPMYYIENGLGEKWKWLALCFAYFTVLASFGIGNTVQANSVSNALQLTFGIPLWVTALGLFVLSAAILLGGIQRIATFSGQLIPAMSILYCVSAAIVIAMHITQIPAALTLIIECAFTPTAASGGFAGATVLIAIQSGVARGLFSNEAGLGSGCIAYAMAKTNHPVRMGLVGMLGTFIDSIIVCSMTGFAIIVTGVWNSGTQGSPLTGLAFEQAFPFGGMIVSVCLTLFAYSTILGWCVYGERCVIYLFGESKVKIFRYLFVLMVPVGALVELELVWILADILNALMAIPNLVALLLLSPMIFKLTRKYTEAQKLEKAEKSLK